MNDPNLDYLLDVAADDAIRFHDLDGCIIGTDQHGCLVYSYHLMIDHFLSQQPDWTIVEAVDWIDYNVAAVNAGYGFTILYNNDYDHIKHADLST
jgi:hypothetical protein